MGSNPPQILARRVGREYDPPQNSGRGGSEFQISVQKAAEDLSSTLRKGHLGGFSLKKISGNKYSFGQGSCTKILAPVVRGPQPLRGNIGPTIGADFLF